MAITGGIGAWIVLIGAGVAVAVVLAVVLAAVRMSGLHSAIERRLLGEDDEQDDRLRKLWHGRPGGHDEAA